MIFDFFIVNSSGSMIYSYQREGVLTANKQLVLCSTLHSVFCMIKKTIKDKTNTFYFHFQSKIVNVHKTKGNLLFLLISDKKETKLIDKIHKEYCNFVMLDPFYVIDMPIHCKKFDPTKYF